MLANVNAQFEKEVDPDGVMSTVFLVFNPRKSGEEHTLKELRVVISAVKKNMKPAVSVVDKEGFKK